MTIRVYFLNGHNAAGVSLTLAEFEQKYREALSSPGRFLHLTDGRGFVHSVRPEAISHAIQDVG